MSTYAENTSVQGAAHDQDEAGVRRSSTLWRRVRGQRVGLVAGVVLVLLAASALFAPLLSPYSPDHLDLLNTTAPPSWSHLFGTDDTGRDMFSRCLYGGRVSLAIGVAAMLVAMAIGILVGAVAGYTGGIVDGIIMRLVDVLLALPSFFLLIVIATLFTPTTTSIILVLGVLASTGTARLVRADILSLREREFVEAARALGVGSTRLIMRHLLPNIVGTITVRASLVLGYAILAESGLSYLGLGIQPPTPSWGNLLSDAQQYLQTAPWLVYPPGILIALTVMCVFLVGNALREVVDPQRQ
jgi:peptide/nickel transport system permease protein